MYSWVGVLEKHFSEQNQTLENIALHCVSKVMCITVSIRLTKTNLNILLIKKEHKHSDSRKIKALKHKTPEWHKLIIKFNFLIIVAQSPKKLVDLNF